MEVPSALTFTITLSLVAVATLFFYLRWLSGWWVRKGVPSYGNVFTGCFTEAITSKKSLVDVVSEFYLKTKKHKCVGTFMLGRPILFLNDPDVIRQVMVSDFGNFNARGFYVDMKNEPVAGNLFVLDGADWTRMRRKLTPIFTSGKIKYMFPTVLDCVKKLDSVFDKDKSTVIKTRFVMSSLSIDVISSVAFGIESNCIENPNAEFGVYGRSFNDSNFIEFFKFFTFMNAHWLAKLLRLKAVRKSIADFFSRIVRTTVEYREKNNVTRNDFMDLMIRLKNSGGIEGSLNDAGEGSAKGITLDEMTAQAFVFFLAGFETTSQANTFTLLELAKNHDIQRTVQRECDKVMEATKGEITYEAVNNTMVYTEQVIRETMRLYTGLQILQRCTLKKCKIPLTDIEVEKGTSLWIPLAALHRDPDCFPDPEKFDPQRFSEENISAIPPGMYMPFGDGPRICIGNRFAMIQMKSLMLYLMSRFDVDVVEDTELTVKLDPKNFFPNPLGNFRLKFTPRNKVHRDAS